MLAAFTNWRRRRAHARALARRMADLQANSEFQDLIYNLVCDVFDGGEPTKRRMTVGRFEITVMCDRGPRGGLWLVFRENGKPVGTLVASHDLPARLRFTIPSHLPSDHLLSYWHRSQAALSAFTTADISSRMPA